MKKLYVPEEYKSEELTAIYIMGLLRGYGIAQSHTHRQMTPQNGSSHLLEKKIAHLDLTIGEFLKTLRGTQ